MTYPLAQAHDLADDGALRVQRRFADNSAQYPAGFAFSTVLDLANFVVMHLGGGRFQDRQIIAGGVGRGDADGAGRSLDAAWDRLGLTWMVDDYKGIRRVSHAGGTSTFGCKFAFVPGKGIGVVLLFNSAWRFRGRSAENRQRHLR